MGQSVMIFAGPADDEALCEYAESLGLRVLPMLWGRLAPMEPKEYPACFLSPLAPSELHPYGDPRVIGGATDPLIEFTRSYYDPPYLVAGRLYWSDDVEDLAVKTKPYFSKLANWIRKRWSKRSDRYYIGPDAEHLVAAGDAQPAYLRPGLRIESIRGG